MKWKEYGSGRGLIALLSRHISGGTEGTIKELKIVSVLVSRFEPGTSRTHSLPAAYHPAKAGPRAVLRLS
jgi:hypothetical protein